MKLIYFLLQPSLAQSRIRRFLGQHSHGKSEGIRKKVIDHKTVRP